MRKTSARYENVLPTREVTGKNVTGTVKVKKKNKTKQNNKLKECVGVPLHFLFWHGSGKPIQQMISFWLCGIY